MSWRTGHTVGPLSTTGCDQNCDWVVDMGPEGGGKGGYVVAEGTPEQVAAVEKSYTGQFLQGSLRAVASV